MSSQSLYLTSYILVGVLVLKMLLSFFVDFDGADGADAADATDGIDAVDGSSSEMGDAEDALDLSIFSLNGFLASMSVFFFASAKSGYIYGIICGFIMYFVHHWCVRKPFKWLKSKAKGIEQEPHSISYGDTVLVDVPVSKEGGQILYKGKTYMAVLEEDDNNTYKIQEELIVIAILDNYKTIVVKKEA